MFRFSGRDDSQGSDAARYLAGAYRGKPIAIVVPEDGEIPADPRVTFDPAAINIYADSWRVGREG